MINKQTKQVLTAPLIKEMQRNHFTKLKFVGTSLVVHWIPHAATKGCMLQLSLLPQLRSSAVK